MLMIMKHSFNRAAPLGVLALLSAGSALPGRADTGLNLTSGAATISGTGTQTTGNGYAYSGGAGAGTTNYAQVDVRNASALTVLDGGTLDGGTLGDLFLHDAARTNILGGSINFLSTDNNSLGSITGGTTSTLDVLGNSQVNISGGTVLEIVPSQNSVTNVTGGTIGQDNNGFGFFQEGGIVNLYGHGLALTPGGYDPLIKRDYQNLDGTLQDGKALTTRYYYYGSGALNLINSTPVPEASSVVSFGLMLALGWGGVLCARKKKTTV